MKTAILILALALALQGCASMQRMDRAVDIWIANLPPPKASLATHKKHAKKRCACPARAWKRCVPLHTVGTPDHQNCMDRHLDNDRERGRMEGSAPLELSWTCEVYDSSETCTKWKMKNPAPSHLK